VSGKGSRPNTYHFDGLIAAAKQYALEKIQQMENKRADLTAVAARKGRPKLRIV